MNKNIFSIILVFLLSGCTLAKEATTVLENDGEVVGVFITTENRFTHGQALDLKDSSQTFALINKHEENGASYVESIISGKFYDGHMDVKVMDEVYVNTFTAKIPFLSQGAGIMVNHYEILKTLDGNFVIGNSLNGIGLSNDGVAGVNFDFSKDVEVNGLHSTETLAFAFEYVPIKPLLTITLIELDAMHDKVKETDLMEISELTLDAQTRSLLVQEQRTASDGSIITSIQAYVVQNKEVIEHSLIRTAEGEQFASPNTLRFIP